MTCTDVYKLTSRGKNGVSNSMFQKGEFWQSFSPLLHHTQYLLFLVKGCYSDFHDLGCVIDEYS